MRVDVKKFLFIGFRDERATFFEKAQEVGCIHFIDKSGMKGREIPSELQSIVAAIKVLRGLPVLEQEELNNLARAHSIVNHILQLKGKLDRLGEELRVLKMEIARIEIFGQFSLDDIAYIQKEGKRKIQFFCAKEGLRHE